MMANAQTRSLTQLTARAYRNVVSAGGTKALSSESPGWEGQHSPTGAPGVILQQRKALPHPDRWAGRDPHHRPHSGCRQTSTAITSQGREKALWVFGSSDSHSSRLGGLLC